MEGIMFNLSDYTTVQERIADFWERYPDGAIRTELVEASNTRFIVFCKLFKNATDPQPFSTGHAQEVISEKGVNRDFALENCETSAVGIAAKFANIGTKKHLASREEMAKVNRVNEPNEYEKKLQERRYGAPGSKSAAVEDALRASFAVDNKQDDPQAWSVAEAVDAIGSSTPKEPPACEHGHILKQGISKTGKPYYGYVCKGKVTEHAKWAKMTANGHWFFEGME
jgi:hypothetical protein